EEFDSVSFYGELSLSGEVVFPDDFYLIPQVPQGLRIMTGWTEESVPHSTYQIKSLKNLKNDPEVDSGGEGLGFRKTLGLLPTPERPKQYEPIEFTGVQAQWIQLIAAGGHPCMIAGSAGAGKTMVAKAVAEFLEEPTPNELFEITRRNITFGHQKWRPAITVHHTATHLSIVGGGGLPQPGEIYRSHQGVLILDEFLEFSKKVQEVLRGPMEEGTMRVSRTRGVLEYPFDTLVIGTTNLCPCGEWVPKQANSCDRALYKCRSYRERLSGPLLDRFQLLFYALPPGEGETHSLVQKKSPSVLGSHLLERLLMVYKFQQERRSELKQENVRNSRLSLIDLQKGMDPRLLRIHFSTDVYNPRRRLAFLSVARTVADLSHSIEVKSEHLEEARESALVNFERIKSLV
ncbi:MAG TPA: ATP-binding protein, partial [Pseudobdellovibrionaceae bacterium]|nr:ATP-binding protein [Pseudobdellovibrionaceae bacterium]